MMLYRIIEARAGGAAGVHHGAATIRLGKFVP